MLKVLHGVLCCFVCPHSSNPVTMLSSKASPSNALSTYIPPGTAEHDFNVTAVVLVSDKLGSTAVTSLGEDGMPVAIVSTTPGEVIYTQNVCVHAPPAVSYTHLTLPTNREV